jgi:hypothetical protein
LHFAYKLASHLKKSVKEILELDADEFINWQIYLENNPTEEEIINYAQANINLTLATLNSDKRFELDDFLFKFSGSLPEDKNLAEKQLTMFKALFGKNKL